MATKVASRLAWGSANIRPGPFAAANRRPGQGRGEKEEPGTPRAAVHRLWRLVGADPAPVDARVHDARMGWVSHLPQVVAVELARSLEEAGIHRGSLGTGGEDMVRLAGSSPAMWTDILALAGLEASRRWRARGGAGASGEDS